jgi:hypothetical protein
MARAKRKNTIKIADVELFKLHDAFAKSYERMKKCDTPAAKRGSGPKSTKQDQAAFRKWEAAASDAFDQAEVVVGSSASTLEGMLMKLHVAGFAITGADKATTRFGNPARSTLTRRSQSFFPYGMICIVLLDGGFDVRQLAQTTRHPIGLSASRRRLRCARHPSRGTEPC